MPVHDLTGKKYNKLTVLKRGNDRISESGRKFITWECICECGNYCKVTTHDLTRKDKPHTRSCGCWAREQTYIRQKKYNEYDLTGAYGVGKSGNTDDLFYFELCDFDKIKDIYWTVHNVNGTNTISGHHPDSNKTVYMHVQIGFKGYDHIDRNELNNLHNNLRPCTHQENCCNRERSKKKSSTGFTGVYLLPYGNYLTMLTQNYKTVFCKTYPTFEEAKIARLKAEAKYFKEFAPHRDLFEQYNITIQNDFEVEI
jgi:hypothetical protein